MGIKSRSFLNRSLTSDKSADTVSTTLTGDVLETTKIDTFLLRSLYPAKLLVTGKISGVQYTFDGAGSEVKVLEIDRESFPLTKRLQSCCGGQKFVSLFEIVEN